MGCVAVVGSVVTPTHVAPFVGLVALVSADAVVTISIAVSVLVPVLRGLAVAATAVDVVTSALVAADA